MICYRKKGFPISYDTAKLIRFLADIKSGKPSVKSPIYSHLTYDIVPDKFDIVDQPDILILEGLNVLQTGSNKANQTSCLILWISPFTLMQTRLTQRMVHQTILKIPSKCFHQSRFLF